MHWYHRFLSEATEAVVSGDGTSTPQNELGSMVTMFSALILIMLLGCAAYGFYTVFRLRRDMVLFPNKFMYPGNCNPDDCLDPPGFILFILPRLTIMSSVMLILGIVFALICYVLQIDHISVDIASMVLPVIVLGWYAVVQRKAAREFWGQ